MFQIYRQQHRVDALYVNQLIIPNAPRHSAMPETDIPSRKSKSQRLLDFMSPSERVLRVHRKNFACARALRLQMEEYDAECRRALRKVEQEIFDVYFDEYLPLKAQARSTSSYLQHLNTVSYIPNIHMRNSRANVKFPLIKNNASAKASDRGRQSVLKDNRLTASATSTEILPSVLENMNLGTPGGRPSPESRTSSPLLVDGVTEERLRIIKAAVALSSQPPPPAPKKKKKKDRSRKIPTITITDASGEDMSNPRYVDTTKMRPRSAGSQDILKDKGLADETSRNSEDNNVKTKFPATIVKSLVKWQPSLARNKIFNDDEIDLEASVSDMGRRSSEIQYGPPEVAADEDIVDLESSPPSSPAESEDYSSCEYGSTEATSSGLSSPILDLEYGHDFPDDAFSSMYSYSQSSFITSDEGM